MTRIQVTRTYINAGRAQRQACLSRIQKAKTGELQSKLASYKS